MRKGPFGPRAFYSFPRFTLCLFLLASCFSLSYSPFGRAPLLPGRVTFEKRVFGFFRDDQRLCTQAEEGWGMAGSHIEGGLEPLPCWTCTYSLAFNVYERTNTTFVDLTYVLKCKLTSCEDFYMTVRQSVNIKIARKKIATRNRVVKILAATAVGN